MASVSFHLKRPDADIPTAIIALVSASGQRTKVYTGLSVLPKKWSKDEQRAKERGYQEGGTINDTLELLQKRLLTYCNEQRALGLLPAPEVLKQLVEPEAPAPAVVVRSFWTYLDEWIATARGAGHTRTAQTYATAARRLQEFEQASGMTVDFDTITPAWGDKFTAYLLHTARLTDNTIQKHVTRLKRFMKWAGLRGYHQSTGYERLTWRRQEPDIMTLTEEEVQRLEGLELPAEGYLANARALFLLACYTGLRYSDLVNIRKEHLRDNKLHIIMQKTRGKTKVPLQDRALPLVQQLVAGEVHPISNQKLNDYLKELGQLAGIDSPIEVIRYRGGHREATTVPKWQKLGCHTGRRTFVTLSLERGLRPEVVMDITGHKDWKSFRRYVNITEQAVDREFAKAYSSSESKP